MMMQRDAEKIAEAAAMLDEDCPGWAQRVALDDVDPLHPAKTLLAHAIGHQDPLYERQLERSTGLIALFRSLHWWPHWVEEVQRRQERAEEG